MQAVGRWILWKSLYRKWSPWEAQGFDPPVSSSLSCQQHTLEHLGESVELK